MINSMSKTENKQFTPSIAISTIWNVNADLTYNVKLLPTQSSGYIAIRTLDGCGILELRDKSKFLLNRNSLLIVKLSHIKCYRTQDSHWKFKWLEFYASDEIPSHFNTVYSLPCTDYEKHEIQICFHLLNTQIPSACLAASAMFSSLLLSWYNTITSQNNTSYENEIEKTVEYINSNINSHLLVSALAKEFSMCERTFRDVFKKRIGISPKQYIEQKRLDLALEYLKNSFMQIKEVSALLGFSNPYYFSRAFKKHFGNSPSEFRKH